MTATDFYRFLYDNFPFQLTLKQEAFLQQFSRFLFDQKSDGLFVLRGYAGTGKTTLISTLVQCLPQLKWDYVLLAPTGRAAKVISSYSGRTAFTIHKRIYYPARQGGSGVSFTLQKNKSRNTLYIVDESSMIGTQSGESGQSLLDDLMSYVYSGTNCKLLLIGDTAQLPPVQQEESWALEPDFLQTQFHKLVESLELDEVMRQEEGSGVLHNATLLREQLADYFGGDFLFQLKGFKDIVRLVDGYDIQDAIQSAYSRDGMDETAIIVRSNKRANQYNEQIRNRILLREGELSAGDYLMVVKNNYFWLSETDEAGFIANGDLIEVLQVYKHYELYGFRFARVKVRMVDYERQPAFETVLLLDTLTSEAPALNYDQANRLYQEVLKDYEDERAMYRKIQKLKQNEYFNALQVKFAYAMTCHKSQGGQWQTVFIEQPYLPDGLTPDAVRWLYTALTRARERAYLIGFSDDFFEN